MVTLPHTDTDNGYSLRVSKNLPPNSANLAYVKSDTPSEEKNLLIYNDIKNVSENKLSSGQKIEFKVFSKNNMKLETEDGINSFVRSNIELTDEYNVLGKREPLYYVARSKYLFDARTSKVYPYINGNQVAQERRFEELTVENKNKLVYSDNRISITKENGVPLDTNDIYKIVLLQDGEESYTYRILVYANFDIYSNIYEIHYPAFELKNKESHKILNFESIFEKIEYDALIKMSEEEKLYKKVYAIRGDQKIGYTIFAPNPKLELSDIDENSRPAHTFQYYIEANLKTRISDKNKALINVGLIYVNETAFNQKNISSAAKRLFYGNKYFPEYISFQNPHTQFGMNIPEQYDYWLADINMPQEHYLDYDILIISGYGNKDFSKFNSSIKGFLNNGGLLIYDNCGDGANVLNTVFSEKNTFINDVSFSKSEKYSAPREYVDIKSFKDRYYSLRDAKSIGKSSPAISLKGNENIGDWKILLNHIGESPSIILKEKEYKGNLIVSNAGLMLDILLGGEEVMKFLTNLIIYYSENKYFVTPNLKDYVYHKDNLFKKEYVQDGKVLYIEDRNDLDQTQIVAKKIMANSVASKMKTYLPEYFKNGEGYYQPFVQNMGNFELSNGSFERTSTKGETEWTGSKLNAIPGWSTEILSGTGVTFSQGKENVKNGYYSIKIHTTKSRSSWYQNLGVIPSGEYKFGIYINNQGEEPFTYGLYDTTGKLVFESEEIQTNKLWKEYFLPFTLKENKELILKIGSHKQNQSILGYIDSVSLKTENTVRMNPKNAGFENLYAYATSPKGEGINLGYNNLKEDNVLKENTVLQAELLVKSYVYQWNNAEAVYKKKYGNSSSIPFDIKNSDGTKVINKLLSIIPALNHGIEWADKTRVYYEIELKDSPTSAYINLEIYDPAIDKYYYTNEGISAINYNDLWWNSYESTVVVRASTSFYGLKVTGRYYNLLLNKNYQIDIQNPATKDERDRWYLRIKNGSFQKKSISSKELRELKEVGFENYYDDKIIGVHEYSVPEYNSQAFYPKYGEREVKMEKAEYIDNKKIKIQRHPIILREEYVVKETLVPANKERTIFMSSNNWWDKNYQPIIYSNMQGFEEDSVVNYKYKINYELGLVEFEDSITEGNIKASYRHDNFKIIRRKFKNERINAEMLTTRDGYTFHFKNEKIANYPQPVIYRDEKSPGSIIHPKEALIDYDNGTVTFFQKMETRIYADYNYFVDEELDYKDVSTITGEIILNKEISFKDEIYVSYLYKENFYEYKGYYDDKNQVFMSLDLNPTAGHTYVQPEIIDGEVRYTVQPTEKLLGKEIYVYILPSTSIYNTNMRTEKNCIRHAFSEEEWHKVKQATPEALMLARIQIRENTIIENTIVVDARSRGGGLKESIKEETIETKMGYTSNFWDIGSFNGMPYYRNGVDVIKIPSKVLKINGGRFTEDDINDIVYKYIAYGNMPIIEYVEE